jgi:type IV pilus assembly protein PilA
MLLHNLRRRASARLAGEESGFTLIELLVVMLILGILAAIAIPAFFNQKDKGNDSQAKTKVRTAATALETYATDNNGAYTGATKAILEGIEPALAGTSNGTLADPVVGGNTYTLTVTAPNTSTTFTIQRTAAGTTYTCGPAANQGKGGCPSDGDWG